MKYVINLFITFFSFTSLFAADHLASSTEEAMTLLKKASAGDRVLLKDGVYNNAEVVFSTIAGTKEKPIWFVAQTPGKVFFEGNSTLSFGGQYIIVSGFTWRNGGKDLEQRSVINYKAGKEEATYCTVQDCVIDEYNNANSSVDNKWISLYGQHNTLTRCLVKGKNNLGATVVVWLQQGVPARHLISYNYFLDRNNAPNSDNGLESIRIGDSKTSFTEAHCIVAFNRFEACDGEIEIISNKSCHNTYLHNSFINSDGGLTLRHGNDCLCDGNYFDGGTKLLSYGIRIIGEGHVVINNCFYNLQGAPQQTFRAPVTLVNGLENTPINGYFPVRRAIISDNIFRNCAMPVIRAGAFSKRPGMTIGPDTVTISNNMIIDEKSNKGNVYEALTPVNHLTSQNNTVWGKALQANEKGFAPGKGKRMESDEPYTKATISTSAGADWSDPAISATVKYRKYGSVLPVQVGPSWNRKY